MKLLIKIKAINEILKLTHKLTLIILKSINQTLKLIISQYKIT